MGAKLGEKSESPILKQILELVPQSVLKKSIKKYKTDKSCSKYFTNDQLINMLFGQLNKCLSLREIAMGVDQPLEFLGGIGLDRSPVKSTMSDGNAKRDYRVFEVLYYGLCGYCREQLRMRPGYKVIKDNILYESVREYDLPDDDDNHILKDETIRLTGKGAVENGVDQMEFRRVAVYIEEGNRTVVLICNNLAWSAATIAELYKRRWLIETFFQLIKQNLQIKTFLGATPNACKSQIFIALIGYLLLELIRRTLSKVKHRFGHFVTLIRVCLNQYNRLSYIINNTQITVRAARKRQNAPPNLFSGLHPEKDFEQLLLDFG